MGRWHRFWRIGWLVVVFLGAGCAEIDEFLVDEFGFVDRTEWEACGERIVLADGFSGTDYGNDFGLIGEGQRAVHLSSPLLAESPEGVLFDDVFLDLPDDFASTDLREEFEAWKTDVAATPGAYRLPASERITLGDCFVSVFFWAAPFSAGSVPEPDNLWSVVVWFGPSP